MKKNKKSKIDTCEFVRTEISNGFLIGGFTSRKEFSNFFGLSKKKTKFIYCLEPSERIFHLMKHPKIQAEFTEFMLAHIHNLIFVKRTKKNWLQVLKA